MEPLNQINLLDENFSYTRRMLETFKEQSRYLAPAYAADVMEIYGHALEKLGQQQVKSLDRLNKNPSAISNFDSKNIKNIQKILQEVEKSSAKLIKESHIEAAAIVASYAQGIKKEEREVIRHRVTSLAHGGFCGWIIKVFSPRAARLFKQAKQNLDEAKNYHIELHTQEMKKKISSNEFTLPQLDIDKIASLSKESLKSRDGVVAFNDVCAIDFKFSKQKIHNQKHSLSVQMMTEKKKGLITETFSLVNERQENVQITSKLVPLNKEYDQYIKKDAKVFEEIFGDKVIPSCNREENHLVNAYLQIFKWGNGQKMRFFRTGSLSKKYEKDKVIRKETAKGMASELLKAALLQHIKEKGLTLDEASQGEPLTINLASVSLLTPDLPRKFFGSSRSKRGSERNQLKNQVKALQSFHNTDQKIVINGRTIPVRFNIMIFNFGVNEGATGDLKFAPRLKLGLDYQNSYNQEALKELERTVARYLSIHEGPAADEVKKTWNEIQYLCKKRTSYLQSSNQYDPGAKIIYLMNIMGDQGAINCMSGKDRTGMMAAMIFSTAWVRSIKNNLEAELKEKTSEPYFYAKARLKSLKSEFSQVLYKTLMSYGGLEITSLNTGGFRGYKINALNKLLNSRLIRILKGFSSLAKD